MNIDIMATQKKVIGKLPVPRGEYQEGNSYGELNLVTRYGSTYMSKHDNNTTAPATLSEEGKVVVNTNDWEVFSDSSGAYEVEEKLTELGYQLGVFSPYYKLSFTVDSENVSVIITEDINFLSNSGGDMIILPKTEEPLSIPVYQSLFFNITTKEYIVHSSTQKEDGSILLAYNDNGRIVQGLFANAFQEKFNNEINSNISTLSYQLGVYSPFSSLNIIRNTDKSVGIEVTQDTNLLKNSGGDIIILPKTEEILNIPMYQSLFFNITTKEYIVHSSTQKEDGSILLAYNDNGNIELGLFASAYHKKIVNRAMKFQNAVVSPITDISYEIVDNNSIIQIKTDNVVMVSGADSEKIKLPQGDYTIENYYALVYDFTDDTIKSVAMSQQTGKNLVILANNQNGEIVSGLFYNSIKYSKSIKYYGKRILFLGDSITGTPTRYVNQLVKLIHPSSYYNRGVHGSTIADSNVEEGLLSFCERMDLPASNEVGLSLGMPTDVDLVIIFGGVNDWGRARDQVLGSISDEIDRTTFYGALHYVISNLRKRYANAHIAVINLHHVHSDTGFFKWNEVNYIDESDRSKGFTYAENTTGSTFADYRNAIKSVGEFYGCQVIDLFQVGFSFNMKEDSDNYSIDGLHPNEEGGYIIAKYIYDNLVE